MNITNETITEVVTDTLNSDNPRLNEVMASFLRHMHDFIREVEPSDEEWMAGIKFLTDVGHTCDDARQEFILLSDVLGITALKDLINNPKPEGATEATVLGPFYRDNAKEMEKGASISRGDKDGEPCAVQGRVTTPDGKPIAGAVLDVWQASDAGLYEQQDEHQPEMNLRGRFHTDGNGYYQFRTVKPHYYPIPGDGPVGKLLSALGRHNYRPAHIHFIVSAKGYEPVVTQFFDGSDPYIESDAVFGVKDSLITSFQTIDDAQAAEKSGVPVGSWLAELNFGLKPES